MKNRRDVNAVLQFYFGKIFVKKLSSGWPFSYENFNAVQIQFLRNKFLVKTEYFLYSFKNLIKTICSQISKGWLELYSISCLNPSVFATGENKKYFYYISQLHSLHTKNRLGVLKKEDNFKLCRL